MFLGLIAALPLEAKAKVTVVAGMARRTRVTA